LLSATHKKFESPASHASAITAIAADGDYCVSAASDSSILVWDLASESILTQIVGHTSGIAAVAICAVSEIVVSCDTSANLVFSSMKTGGFLQRQKLERVPDQILLSPLGFCVFLFFIEGEFGFETRVLLTDIQGRSLARKKYEGKTTACRIIENQDASSFVIVAQETNVLYVLTVWDLRQVAAGPVVSHVMDIGYEETERCLYLLLENGGLHRVNFAVSS
jgi:WD40 repeat protein